jgi:hypothetical protein
VSPARAIPGRKRIKGWKGWSLLAIVLAVALAFPILNSEDGRADCPVRLSRLEQPDGNPLAGGDRVSFSEAERRARHEILRPQDPLASDETLTAVWASDRGRHVGLLYESGIQVVMEPLNHPEENMVSPYGQRARRGRNNYTTTILGAPALVNPGSPPCSFPAMVMMVVDAHVQILGERAKISEEEMLRIAASVVRSRVGADENSVTGTQR